MNNQSCTDGHLDHLVSTTFLIVLSSSLQSLSFLVKLLSNSCLALFLNFVYIRHLEWFVVPWIRKRRHVKLSKYLLICVFAYHLRSFRNGVCGLAASPGAAKVWSMNRLLVLSCHDCFMTWPFPAWKGHFLSSFNCCYQRASATEGS